MQYFNQKRIFSPILAINVYLFWLYISPSTEDNIGYIANTVLFSFSCLLIDWRKSENFFCCLNKCLITIYRFQLVRNKKTVFLLELKMLTQKPEPLLSAASGKAGVGSCPPDPPSGPGMCTAHPERSALSFEKHQTAFVTGQVSAQF